MSVAKTPRMKHILFLLTLLSLSTGGLTTTAQAISYDSEDGQPRNSWEQQQETYRKHNYDTYRNGPLPETQEQERRQENRKERNRQDQRRGSSQDNRRGEGGGYSGGDTCKGLYGC